MGTTVLGNPRQLRQANKGATWALSIILGALVILAFIGWNRFQSPNSVTAPVSAPVSIPGTTTAQ